MSINLEKAQKEFIEYTEKYDLRSEKLKSKQQHSLRVMQISKLIAENLQLTQEDVELATLIGLLHDIARFEQYTQYKTFRDIDSIDHGDYGVTILEKDIRNYIETDKNDSIIKIAIKNHNKYKIEEGLSEKENLFAKIIRDADKIDIFYESAEIFWKGNENIIENSTITDDVIMEFKVGRQVKRRKNKRIGNEINEIISVIAFIYDLNFKPSFEILQKEKYIDKILNRYNIKDEYTKKEVEEIKTIANKYIEQKINEK